MHLSVQVEFRRADQPTADAWAHCVELAGQVAVHGVTPQRGDDKALEYRFERVDDPGLLVLEAELGRAAHWGVRWERFDDIETDEEDFESADFLEICGAGVDAHGSGPFVLNAAESFGPRFACPTCGWAIGIDGEMTARLQVDESQLGAPSSQLVAGVPLDSPVRPGSGRWDLVNVGGSYVLVSARCVEVLRHAGGSCWATSPVDDQNGRPSTDLALLAARRILRPCVEHSQIGEEGVCPTCGTVLGDRIAPVALHYRRTDIGDAQIFSVGALTSGPLVVSRELFNAMREADLDGVNPITPFRVCDH